MVLLILKAIAQGKHVVTANKAVIYNHGDEIFDAARWAPSSNNIQPWRFLIGIKGQSNLK